MTQDTTLTQFLNELSSCSTSLYNRIEWCLKFLPVALWNVNEMEQHAEEIKTFLAYNQVHVHFISEKEILHPITPTLAYPTTSLPYESSRWYRPRWDSNYNKTNNQIS